MKRLIVLVVLVFAGWYGYKHYNEVLHPRPRHIAEIVNDSGRKLVRVRLTVGGQTFVKEEMDKGVTADFPFTVDADSQFDLVWEYDTSTNVGHWVGGLVAPGPIVGKHTMTIRDDGGVVFGSTDL